MLFLSRLRIDGNVFDFFTVNCTHSRHSHANNISFFLFLHTNERTLNEWIEWKTPFDWLHKAFLNLICIYLHKAKRSSISFVNLCVRVLCVAVLCYLSQAVFHSFINSHTLTRARGGQWGQTFEKENVAVHMWTVKLRIVWIELCRYLHNNFNCIQTPHLNYAEWQLYNATIMNCDIFPWSTWSRNQRLCSGGIVCRTECR